MNPITIAHIRKAAEWARTAAEPQQIGDEVRRYDQSRWDCGTSCCMWGAASILAGNGPTYGGPLDAWGIDARHKLVTVLLRSSRTTPEQVIAMIDNANLPRPETCQLEDLEAFVEARALEMAADSLDPIACQYACQAGTWKGFCEVLRHVVVERDREIKMLRELIALSLVGRRASLQPLESSGGPTPTS